MGSPAELAPKSGIEAGVFEGDDPGGEGRFSHLDAIAGAEGKSLLSVGGEVDILAAQVGESHFDDAIGRDDEGARGEGVGADGSDDNDADLGVDDGASGGEGVAGGAGGGGDDHAIGGEVGNGVARDAGLEAEEAGVNLIRCGAPCKRDIIGDIKGLTLLVDFSDKPATISHAEVNDYINKPGYNGFNNNGSVNDFFLDVSNGKMNYAHLDLELLQ